MQALCGHAAASLTGEGMLQTGAIDGAKCLVKADPVCQMSMQRLHEHSRAREMHPHQSKPKSV